MNQMASKGVTPENNAAVAIIKILGPAPIKAATKNEANRSRFYKKLGIAPPPEKGDYFVDFFNYVKRYAPETMEIPLKDKDYNTQWSFEEERCGKPWSKEDCPLMAAYLASNDKSLDRIIEASRLPRFNFPLVMHKDSLVYCSLVSDSLRRMSRSLAYRAMFRVQEGKIQEAWNDLLACHRLALLQKRGAMSFVEYLNAMYCENTACYGDRQLAHYAKLTPKQAKLFSADIEEISYQWSQIEFRIVSDRFRYLDSICATARGSMKPIDMIPKAYKNDWGFPLGGDTPEWNSLRDSLTKWIDSGQVDWNEALRLGNVYFDNVEAIRRKTSLPEQYQLSSELNEENERRGIKYHYPHYRDSEALRASSKSVVPPSKYTEGVFVVYLLGLGCNGVGAFAEIETTIHLHLVPVSMALSLIAPSTVLIRSTWRR